MSILDNAVNSIQIGLEDFENNDHRRNVSAVRNIFAGILLLYKEKLRSLSPSHDKELLVKQRLVPELDSSGAVIFKGQGKNTVDVQSIRERFKSLRVRVDWKRFEKINDLRNDMEHYHSTASLNTVEEIIADSFLLIRDFSDHHLGCNPIELLGQDCWSRMLKTRKVFTKEKWECRRSIRSVNWKYSDVRKSLRHLRCNSCHSPLIEVASANNLYPEIDLHCRSCGVDFCFNDVVENCIDELLSGIEHSNIMDGGEASLYCCPECQKCTFLRHIGTCVACEYEMDYTNCSVCEEYLSVDEQDLGGLCSYCQYKFDQTMAE